MKNRRGSSVKYHWSEHEILQEKIKNSAFEMCAIAQQPVFLPTASGALPPAGSSDGPARTQMKDKLLQVVRCSGTRGNPCLTEFKWDESTASES